MSNHLAVAATTRTLAQLLDGPLSRDVPGAHCNPGRPDVPLSEDAEPEARLFLYRVEPNASWRTTALPTRSSTGGLLERPQIGLTLNYLLGFVGSESTLEPQRMLGSVVRTLAAHPLLSRADIEAMVAAALIEDPQHPLALTDLAEQPETVRINPLPLTLDELAGLWSGFGDAPYRLSVAYEASVVVLTAEEPPTRALPVRTRHLVATTILRPTIAGAEAAQGAFEPVQVGTTLVITGTQLRGAESTTVGFGAVEVTPDPGLTTGNRVEVVVPGTVRAGVTGVRIIHRRLLGEPPAERLAGQSGTHPVVVHPRVLPLAPGAVHGVEVDPDTDRRSGSIAVSLEPAVGSAQHVTLLLNAAPGGSGQSYVFEDERRDREGDPEQTPDLDIPFAGVEAGTYLLRISVDGAETPLAVDGVAGSPTEGQYVGPTVVVP